MEVQFMTCAVMAYADPDGWTHIGCATHGWEGNEKPTIETIDAYAQMEILPCGAAQVVYLTKVFTCGHPAFWAAAPDSAEMNAWYDRTPVVVENACRACQGIKDETPAERRYGVVTTLYRAGIDVEFGKA
jgi:hypothetical protein